ncbi:MAG: aminoglycoside phosphotransferase family protein [Ardenticatenaceae bacterium]|nr:aminoglycoside phosphotransferase family protein [Ardenticatenaceae bacterium]
MERTMFLPNRMDWEVWGGLFTETAVWLPIIYRICQQVGLSVNTVEAGYPGTCAVFVVNEGTVVKIYPPMLPHDFARECEVYQQLTGRLAQMPRLLGSGVYRDQLDWPYLLLSFCPGEPIRELYQQLERYSERQLGQELGEMLREVHATPLASLQAFDTRPAAWHRFLRRRQAAIGDELRQRGSLPPQVIAEVEQFLATMMPLLCADERLCLLHADLTEDHLLLVEENGRFSISALIDWADAEVGTVGYEWVALWYGLCNRNLPLFRSILGSYDPAIALNAAFGRRMLAYTCLHRFGAAIIDHVWRLDDRPVINNLADLEGWLWPEAK